MASEMYYAKCRLYPNVNASRHNQYNSIGVTSDLAIERRLSPMHCASSAVIGMRELDHVMAETFAIEASAMCLGNTGC